MNGPFVVVVAGATGKVGKTTVANNLAVYLKALREELPVTLLSFDERSRLDAMFSLGDGRAAAVSELFAGNDLGEVSRLGQFGVRYLSTQGPLPAIDDPSRLRRILAGMPESDVVIVDAGEQGGGLWRNAIWAADLVLAPVGGYRCMPRLNSLRSTLVEGGGSAEMLWLLPSRLGTKLNNDSSEEPHRLLRFAADERGCQVLEQELSEDQRVHIQASAKDRSVLTRLPGSYVHEELKQLAEFVLQRVAGGPCAECRLHRLLADGVLPRRARRVNLICPLCGRLVIGGRGHYLESVPKRHRGLLHAECLSSLLDGTNLHAFLPLSLPVLVRTGVEGSGLRSELRLLLSGPNPEPIARQQLRPETGSGWEPLLRTVTGFGINEQRPGLLAISAEGQTAHLLEAREHRRFAWQRHVVFRRACGNEEY